MTTFISLIDRIPWNIIVIACLTLGLAPFFPEPHIWEKLKMLFSGTLSRPVDIFDFAMHGLPFLIAAAKLAVPLLKAG